MAIFADGGDLGSKPYAAGGNYISKMSDFCRHCRFDVRQKSGENACPFNYLYWNFLIENEKKLAGNRRLALPYQALKRMDGARKAEIRRDARRFLKALVPWQPAP
jgi:deoxyribodipyrimidine photolyase-related protein